MAETGHEDEYRLEEGVAMQDTTNHLEPVATEPLKRVGREKELTSETVVDKDFVHEKAVQHGGEEDRAEVHAIARSGSNNSGSGTSDSSKAVEKFVKKDAPGSKQSWHKWLTLRSRYIPPIPKERIVSREYNANIFSIITFQWMSPLMSTGYQRTLEHNDLWLVNPNRRTELLAETLKASFQKRVARKDKRPLLGAMYDTFRFEFILGGVCQLIASVLQVINPFILKYLITFAAQAYEAPLLGIPGPNVGKGVGIVIAITVIQLITSGCSNQFLYRGMMNGGQARSVLISLIFDKSMKLSGRAKAGGLSIESTKAEGAGEMPSDIQPGSKEEKQWFNRRLANENKAEKDAKKQAKKDKKKPKIQKGQKGVSGDGQGWGNGRIVNLMSVDTYRIDQAAGMFHMLWTSPLVILITLALLLVNITYSALAGFALIVIAMPVLGRSIKSLFRRRKAINKITDQRVSLTQEILQAVRFVKYFGWEESFLHRIGDIRSREIRSIQFLLAIRNAIVS